jgi:uncharacterized glyoxalase superfamily protein PhnB
MKPIKFYKTTPFLPVKNLRQTLDYYRETLGFYEEWTWGAIDGGIRRDDMRMIFCEDTDYVQILNTDTHWFVLIWFVDNADAIYNELIQKNIPIAAPIKNEPWGIREFAFRDINGYYIRVSEGINKEEQE